MSNDFSNIERNRTCIFGRSTNHGNMSQGQRKTNAFLDLDLLTVLFISS